MREFLAGLAVTFFIIGIVYGIFYYNDYSPTSLEAILIGVVSGLLGNSFRRTMM